MALLGREGLSACLLAAVMLIHVTMPAGVGADTEMAAGLEHTGTNRRLLQDYRPIRMCLATSFDAFLNPRMTTAAAYDSDQGVWYGSCRTYNFLLTVKNVYKRTTDGKDEFMQKYYNFTGLLTAGNPYSCPAGRNSSNVAVSLLERIVMPADGADLFKLLQMSREHAVRPLPPNTPVCYDKDISCSIYVSSYCVLNFPTAPPAPNAPIAPPMANTSSVDTSESTLETLATSGTSEELKKMCPVTCMACRPDQWQLVDVVYMQERSMIYNMTCCYGNGCNNASTVIWGEPFDVPDSVTTTEKKLSNGAIAGIVVGCVVATILLALLVGFLVRKSVVARGKKETIDELRIKWSDIIIEGTIGQGGFGDVYKGKWQKHPVAVKMLHNNMRDDLLKECLVMSQLRHPHIARVYGLVDEGDILAMVMHYYKQGTVDGYFNAPEYQQLTVDQRLMLAVQVARGMNYMHNRPAPLLHGDLKCSNLLLDDDGKVVITDFGLARKYTPSKTISETGSSALSVNISPPEVIENPAAPRLAPADVYAFGIVLLEIMSGKSVYRGLTAQMVMQAVREGKRPNIPDDGSVPDSVRALIERCWAQDPAARPEFKDVLMQIERIHQDLDSFSKQDSFRANTFAHGSAPSQTNTTQFMDAQTKAFPTY